MSADYPDSESYQTPHPLFNGVHEVQSATQKGVTYEVNLGTGECTCAHGKAWRWSSGKWQPNSWCSHKMKSIASIIAKSDFAGVHKERAATAQSAYNMLLGKRYIIWESVSAFHKELRRGDYKEAQYWALSVAAHRGLSGVIRYMLNIIFEETRDLDLFLLLIRLTEKGRAVSYDETMAAVRLFCKSPKKWELEPRLAIFLDEMRGYRALAKDYTYAVARGKDIIPHTENEKLLKALVSGICTGDKPMTQYGLKGFFKSQHPKGHNYIKVQLFNGLTDCLNSEGAFVGDRFDWNVDYAYAHRLHSLVMRRYEHVGDFGYHELNALCDALTGERYDSGANLTPSRLKRLYGATITTYAPPLGIIRAIPLYALDNHNHRGKHLMNKWGSTELLPGAQQEHLDFCWCGAYMGVAWRYLAYNQLQSCDVAWGDVKWNKVPWLWKHLDKMWY